MRIPWLDPKSTVFPNPNNARKEPNGLLAAGGDLSPERILAAYRLGIFPWFNPGDPILWWSPNPRTVIRPAEVHISKSLRKTLRQATYTVTFDRAFGEVMRACAEPRSYSDGTWISEQIIQGYSALHQQGHAHSVEVWLDKELVGGLYGLALGKVFFGESMFSRTDNTSKIAFAYLARQLQLWDFRLIDCQVANPHLFSLGAIEIQREEFQQILLEFTDKPVTHPLSWSGLFLEDWNSDS
jgi:leucyl/phenylalanyl-tRNA---protein transferase